MKRSLVIILILVLSACPLILGAQGTRREKDLAKQENIQVVKDAIEDGNFKLVFNWAIPASGKNISLSTEYVMKVMQDSVSAHLPFFGRAYSLPYGGDGGIQFDTKAKDFESVYIDKGRKSRYEFSFGAQAERDYYSVRLQVYPEGNAYMTVLSNNRATISYRGYLKPVEKKEK